MLSLGSSLSGQQPQSPAAPGSQADQAVELAKQLSNPVASLISVPIQTNYDFGIGPSNSGFRFTTNVQPVIPIALTPKLNLITRNILPVLYQTDIFAPLSDNTDPQNGAYAGQGDQYGLGDLTSSFFLSPSAPLPGKLILGVGPAFLVPTATDKYLGSGKWGVGPTVVILRQSGHWTVGALYNHIFSFAGQSARPDVSSSFLQPFLSYAFKDSTTLTLNLESTHDFAGDNGWTVPINFTAGKIFKLGSQLTNFTVGARYYAEGPTGAPDWGLRFVVTLLYPKKPKANP